jgi:hypothetical protein
MDVDAESSASAILAALQIEDEPELALRLGSVYAPRLAPLVSFTYGLSAPARPALSRISQGTVLITGGTGELGSELARHLVNRYGARSLILISRRGTDSSGASALVMELTKLGANVQVVACDVANRQALSDVISSIPATLPLRAVIHCAAQLDDGLIMELTSDRGCDGVGGTSELRGSKRIPGCAIGVQKKARLTGTELGVWAVAVTRAGAFFQAWRARSCATCAPRTGRDFAS